MGGQAWWRACGAGGVFPTRREDFGGLRADTQDRVFILDTVRALVTKIELDNPGNHWTGGIYSVILRFYGFCHLQCEKNGVYLLRG